MTLVRSRSEHHQPHTEAQKEPTHMRENDSGARFQPHSLSDQKRRLTLVTVASY